jgi:hypothetical protein
VKAARALLARLLAEYPIGEDGARHALTVNEAGELVVMLNLPAGWCDVVLDEGDLTLDEEALYRALSDVIDAR